MMSCVRQWGVDWRRDTYSLILYSFLFRLMFLWGKTIYGYVSHRFSSVYEQKQSESFTDKNNSRWSQWLLLDETLELGIFLHLYLDGLHYGTSKKPVSGRVPKPKPGRLHGTTDINAFTQKPWTSQLAISLPFFRTQIWKAWKCADPILNRLARDEDLGVSSSSLGIPSQHPCFWNFPQKEPHPFLGGFPMTSWKPIQ